eukprot:NODE_4115_length_814_cov_60.844250_g4092_i0.p1 GENE.NODE_4115_length_814_cov_60.844250_g4092_i0~~NODE_4115_length_814_cov_60.844250_g4092_i0.p1  ORF type:complete len:167 (+),score=16.25 NODE_4115_length_814_cov_60.844250_g4092_i0:83-583(+)
MQPNYGQPQQWNQPPAYGGQPSAAFHQAPVQGVPVQGTPIQGGYPGNPQAMGNPYPPQQPQYSPYGQQPAYTDPYGSNMGMQPIQVQASPVTLVPVTHGDIREDHLWMAVGLLLYGTFCCPIACLVNVVFWNSPNYTARLVARISVALFVVLVLAIIVIAAASSGE